MITCWPKYTGFNRIRCRTGSSGGRRGWCWH